MLLLLTWIIPPRGRAQARLAVITSGADLSQALHEQLHQLAAQGNMLSMVLWSH